MPIRSLGAENGREWASIDAQLKTPGSPRRIPAGHPVQCAHPNAPFPRNRKTDRGNRIRYGLAMGWTEWSSFAAGWQELNDGQTPVVGMLLRPRMNQAGLELLQW